MKWWRFSRFVTLQVALGLILSALLPAAAPAQEEVTSAIRRYKEREASTGYYEEHEVKPRRDRPFVGVPGVMRKLFPYSPKAAQVRSRTHLADSHRGIQFYAMRRCDECHVEEGKHGHTVRGNITCRQCHGGEPIASINHYFSPLNPIRRHSYVCSKCHEGASVSFATFMVHEPKAGDPETRKTFPLLYYANWFMLLLLVGVFAFFIPHSVIWVVREFIHKPEEKPHAEGKPQDEPRE
ncbi:MAG: hypothetical protein FJ134_02340 [Deltaproteobacteria bacterium]|nr:hypothetical protein [Deltaproteobacteria bacterium]